MGLCGGLRILLQGIFFLAATSINSSHSRSLENGTGREFGAKCGSFSVKSLGCVNPSENNHTNSQQLEINSSKLSGKTVKRNANTEESKQFSTDSSFEESDIRQPAGPWPLLPKSNSSFKKSSSLIIYHPEDLRTPSSLRDAKPAQANIHFEGDGFNDDSRVHDSTPPLRFDFTTDEDIMYRPEDLKR